MDSVALALHTCCKNGQWKDSCGRRAIVPLSVCGPPPHSMYQKHTYLAVWIRAAELIGAEQATPAVAGKGAQAANQKASMDCAAADMPAVFVVKKGAGKNKAPDLPVAA